MTKRHDVDDIDDGDETIRDGERVTVRMMAFDSAAFAGNRPGFRTATDADDAAVADARAEYISRLTSAWRSKDTTSAADAVIATEIAAAPPRTDPRVAALAARDAWLKDAWRSP